MKEAEKQLSDENVYRKVKFKEKILTDLVETSNCLLKNLKIKGPCIITFNNAVDFSNFNQCSRHFSLAHCVRKACLLGFFLTEPC